MDEKRVKTCKLMYSWAEHAQRPGGELDWFAIDQDGYLAGFATAGFGPVPDIFFELGLETYLSLIELIEENLGGLAPTQIWDGFDGLAQRGLHVYDFQAWGSWKYESIDTSHSPVRLLDIISLGFRREMFVPFKGRFVETKLVIPEQHWDCR